MMKIILMISVIVILMTMIWIMITGIGGEVYHPEPPWKKVFKLTYCYYYQLVSGWYDGYIKLKFISRSL